METKRLKILFVLLLSTSIFIMYLKYQQYEITKQRELELNNSLELIKSDLQTYKLEYNLTHPLYLDQKVNKKDIDVAISRALLLRNKLIHLNVSKDEIDDIDRCLNETYTLKNRGEFSDALAQGRVCAILASDYLGSFLVIANREEFIKYASEELQNLTNLRSIVDRKWKEKLNEGVNFIDYMILGFLVEDKLIEAEIFLNSSSLSLKELQKSPDPTMPEEIENTTLLGSRITSDLEFARSFLEDALIFMNHVDGGDFKPDELKEEVYTLKENLSKADKPCTFPMAMVKVACDWKDYHKKRSIIGIRDCYYSAATYHLLYALAVAENLGEFESLESAFNTAGSTMNRTKIIIGLRHEALNSLNTCSSDQITSLYIRDAVRWYFKRADFALRRAITLRIDNPTTQPLYDYEMAKILAQKMCPYISMTIIPGNLNRQR